MQPTRALDAALALAIEVEELAAQYLLARAAGEPRLLDAAQMRAVMFRGNNRLLKFQPQDGLSVLVFGSVTVYERRGDYQIVQGLNVDDFGRSKMAATEAELREERAGVKDLL